MTTEISGITGSNAGGGAPLPTDTELILEAVHRIDHRTADIDRRLAALEADWARFRPTAEAFGRGGVLAARTAARQARKQGG